MRTAIYARTSTNNQQKGLENARAKGKKIGRSKERNSELIRSLRSQGMSYRNIAKLTGYSISTISRDLNCDITDQAL